MAIIAPFTPFTLHCPHRTVTFCRPAIMGIVNATPDSFYDGGRYNSPQAVVQQALHLVQEGANIIDLGVVSTRPGSTMPSTEQEAEKLSYLAALLRQALPDDIILSVDTCRSLPAQKAVEAGADMVNDISGGQLDDHMFHTVAELQVPYVLMHMRGTPATMQLPENTCYGDIVDDMVDYFKPRIDTLLSMGVKDIVVDPGFGFAKTVEQNHELLNRLPELANRLPQLPMLVALSNKSMITRKLSPSTQSLGLPDSEFGTLSLNTVALCGGASMLRVHTPRPTKIAIDLLF